ncbi:MATE family efflux transporter [Clostridia bacterium OttesenSCG-928-F22]|nr:MATE family efflux transporter [Clostridia bacterium OttesenSCG-928-F22]
MEQTQQPKANPLGTEPIGKLIIRFAIPAVIALLVNAIYNIVDQIFIGNSDIGMFGIAATNVAFPLVTIGTSLALLFGIGGAANFNLSLGRKEYEKASLSAGNALSLLTIFGLGVGLIASIFLLPMLNIFGATSDIMPLATSYTRIIAIGIPFMIFTTGACQLIRADGSPTYSMMCLVSGAVFNLVFDPIFLYVFNMGIEGIALATILGQLLTSIIALVYMLKRFKSVPLKAQHLRIKLEYFKMIISLGMASFFNQIAMTVVQIALNNTLRHYGALSKYGSEIPLACVGAISKVNILFMAFTIGIAQACQPINGYNYGAKNYARVRQTLRLALTAATTISVIVFLVFQIFPREVISIFGPGSEEYFEFAVRYLRIYMFMTFANGIQPITSNFFTSIGKAKISLFIAMTRQVIFLLPLLLILPLSMGIDGVTFAGPIADAAAAILACTFIAREFRKIKKLEQEQLIAAVQPD